MPQNLVTSVRREIDRLKKEIDQKTSELASLKDELLRHQRVYQFLGGGDRRPRRPKRPQRRPRRIAPANWNSVLQGLPSRFTVGDLAKEAVAGRKSSGYARQVAVRWAKQGKTKRVGRGNYEKVQQAKSGGTVAPRRKISQRKK